MGCILRVQGFPLIRFFGPKNSIVSFRIFSHLFVYFRIFSYSLFSELLGTQTCPNPLFSYWEASRGYWDRIIDEKVFLELACPFLRGHFRPALEWLLGRWRCLKVFFRKLRVTHFGKTVRAKKRFAKPFTPPCHHWGKRRESIEEPHGEHGGIVQGKQKNRCILRVSHF